MWMGWFFGNGLVFVGWDWGLYLFVFLVMVNGEYKKKWVDK